ncbi:MULTISPECIES: universal stress protein [Pontibacter]|uniref:Nucleotide-binding universal stress protein, UspA family n=1 Tax=Pontibacter lucknowensis TaxID=1077936 RepID=A0A1N6YDS1_9BACT|nr:MULTISPECIES: universal stress protein [Pontibacter]EJF10114.1 UspA domain-containing protein [Pontibacter sp. BAB1700]SIR12710.1 Nucleotide-binding universal stress protein, UspA family [Pontibacter lucknowensis]
MKKILCPTDFSKTAAKALDYAVLIARQSGGHLTLLHVVHLPIVDTSETALVASELLGEQMRDAEERLVNLCREIEERHGANRGGGFTCDYILKEALLTDITEHLTKTSGYDLIVMGTTGGGNALEELLIGSNAEAVMEQVKCPVLSIPSTSEYPRINKIVYASDYAQDDIATLREVLDFASMFGASVDVVHVNKEGRTSSDKKGRFVQEMEAAFPGAPIHFEEVVSKHRADGIKEYYDASGADMVAVLRREKGFLRELFSQSLAEKMTYQAEVPLLVLKGRR